MSLDGHGSHESTHIVVEITIFFPHTVVSLTHTSIVSRGSTRVSTVVLRRLLGEVERLWGTHAHDAKLPRDGRLNSCIR